MLTAAADGGNDDDEATDSDDEEATDDGLVVMLLVPVLLPLPLLPVWLAAMVVATVDPLLLPRKCSAVKPVTSDSIA